MFKKFIKFTEEAEKKVYGKDIPEDKDIVQQEGKIIIKRTSEAEAAEMSEAFNKVFKNSTTIDGREVLENLDTMEIPTTFTGDYLNIIKQKNKKLFDHLKRGKVTTADMIQYAEQLGERQIIRKLIKLEPGELVKADDIFAGMLVVHKNLRKIEKNYKKIKDLSDTDVEVKKLNEEIGFLSSINKNIGLNIKAVRSEFGRGLRDPLQGNVIESVIFQETASKGASIPVIKRAANSYLALPANNRSNFLAKDGWLAKTNRVVQEIYINALLSSPVTHIVNIASNAAFQLKSLFDTGIAGTVGSIRVGAKKLLGQEFDEYDRVMVGEAAAELFGGLMSQQNALALMSRTFVKGEAPDLLSKTELEEMRAIGKERSVGGIIKQFKEGDHVGSFLSAIGSANSIPGRLLATGDEYFKVTSRGRYIYKEAYKEAMTNYQITRNADNGSAEEAMKSFKETLIDRIENPTEGTIEGSKQFAKKMTFQQELGNSFPEKGVRALMEISPLMRYLIPFVRTPTNVIKEALGSTLNAVNPKFYQQLRNASGREFDQLVGKLVVGNGIAATMVSYSLGLMGDDIRITGAGPSAKGAKKYWDASGIPQYSIGVKQEDGTYEWTSYSRFDPISGILAMSADAAYYIQNEDNPDAIQGVMNALTVSITNYAGQLPFLQGVSDLTRMFGDIQSDPMRSKDALLKFLGQKTGNVVTSLGRVAGPASGVFQDYLAEYSGLPIPPSSSSYTATLERVQDPTLNEVYKLEDLEVQRQLPSFMRGFYIALQQAKSRNPRFSKDLLPKLNFWGEELKQTEGRWDEYFNPLKRTTSRGESPLEKELINLANKTGNAFANHPRAFLAGKQRVELSAPLYNTYVKNINTIDDRGRLPDDPGYNFESSLVRKLESIVRGDGRIGRTYQETRDPGDRYSILNAVLTSKRKQARDKLYEGTDLETQKLNFYLGRE